MNAIVEMKHRNPRYGCPRIAQQIYLAFGLDLDKDTVLRILDIKEINSLPNVPISHPFVERVIGSIRRELLDQTCFWTAMDLEHKLRDYQEYYNDHRTYSSRNGETPVPSDSDKIVDVSSYRW